MVLLTTGMHLCSADDDDDVHKLKPMIDTDTSITIIGTVA